MTPLKLVLLESPRGRLPRPRRRSGRYARRRHRTAPAGAVGPGGGRGTGTSCCYATPDKFWVQGAPNGDVGRFTPCSAIAPPSRRTGTPYCGSSDAPPTWHRSRPPAALGSLTGIRPADPCPPGAKGFTIGGTPMACTTAPDESMCPCTLIRHIPTLERHGS